MIYLVKIVGMPILKIGYSDKFDMRMATLYPTIPFDLEHVAERTGSVFLEAAVHAAVAPWRIKGEWYEDSDAVRDAFFQTADPEPRCTRRDMALWFKTLRKCEDVLASDATLWRARRNASERLLECHRKINELSPRPNLERPL